MMLDIEDADQLRAYLVQTGKLPADAQPTIRVLAGGVSNRTVLVETESEQWVIKQALERLRVATEWHSAPQRIHREALGLCHLPALTPTGTIPAFVFEDEVNHVLAMQAVPSPHENWKTRLLAGGLETRHVEQFAQILGLIHSRSHSQSNFYADLFADQTYFETLRIEPYYRYSAAQAPAARVFIADLIDATRAQHLALVHGDYSPKNILIQSDQLILLDHEVIHWGDPAFDVGFGLTHLLSKGHHLSAQRTQFAQAACHFWEGYSRLVAPTFASFPEFESRTARHLVACLLARAIGRSPLEYLSPVERERQRDAALTLIADLPVTIFGLIDRFIQQIDNYP